jgi:translation initiation factor 3 subunit A
MLMELSESRASAARQKADRVALAAAAKIADLDQEETPESIMLSSMTEEVAKDRTDREVVVPWLKFLWETYRAILELLHKNAKLEKVYHKTCEKAFKFCLDYQRNLEFRRLCDMLRQQLAALQRMATTPARTNRIAWEWTPEAVEMHLHTRFVQLEVATSLELWNEGFQTVEDIYEIMVIGRKAPKPKLMATYYEKLTRIFWVAENQLFHAYAWFKYYCLSLDSRKDVKGEERSFMASAVLLSALSIPSTRDTTDPSALHEEDEIASEKNRQMAKLLDFQANPTRKALLEDIIARGVLDEALPEVTALYYALETKFNPLGLVKALTPFLTSIKSHANLVGYAVPLQRVAIVRIVQQLSRVYSVVKMDFLQRLLAGLEDISFHAVEKIMIDGIARKQLQLRIDHRTGVVRFGASTASAAGTIENQVAQLGATLNKVAHDLSVTLGAAALAESSAASRKEFFARVLDATEEQHLTTLDRKSLIERRKEELEKVQLEKQKEAERIQQIEEERRKKRDEERVLAEQRQREDEKKRKLMETQELVKLQKELEKYSVSLTMDELQEKDSDSRRALLETAKSEAQKAKEDEGRRVTDQAKRLDHITRALRIEAAEIISKKYQEQVEEDRKVYEQKVVELQEESRKQHDIDLIEKARLARMQPLRAAFDEALLAGQRAVYQKKVNLLREKALKEFRERKVATARRLFREEMERLEYEGELERERISKEERDALEREHDEVLRRKRQEEEEAERAKEAEQERLRKEREAAREVAREAAAQQAASVAAAAPAPSEEEPAEDRGGEEGWQRTGPFGRAEKDRDTRGGGGGGDRFERGDARGGDRDARGPRFTGAAGGSGGGREEGGWGRGPKSQADEGAGGWGRGPRQGDRPERQGDRPERQERPERSTADEGGSWGRRSAPAPPAGGDRDRDREREPAAWRGSSGGGGFGKSDAPAPTRNLDDWG